MEPVKLSDQLAAQIGEVSNYSRLAYDRGLVTAAGGNVSMRCGSYIVLTASGVSLRDIDASSVLICGPDGAVLENPGGLRPTKEWQFHINIYTQYPEIDSIIHVHPPYAVAYTYHGKEIPMVTGSAEMKLKRVPNVPYEWPGSKTLADTVMETVKAAGDGCHGVVLQRHGIIAYEKGMAACFDTAELIEDTARIAMLAGA